MSKTLNFEQSMNTLETIVKQLETGDLPLEDALTIYEKGVKLAAQCQQALSKAEQKIAILSNIGTDKEHLEPYELASQPNEEHDE